MPPEQKPWFALALQLRGSVIPAVLPRVLVCGLLAGVITLLHFAGVPVEWKILGGLVTNVVFSLVLGLLLVFRTNTAYERFWEGRKAWGKIVVAVRNLSRQLQVAVSEHSAEERSAKVSTLKLLGAFAIATKLRLRSEPISPDLEAILSPQQILQLQQAKNPPLTILLWIAQYLQNQHQQQSLAMDQLSAMNSSLEQMTEALTGCERILNTPIPLAYAIHLHQLLLMYCLSLPFQMVEEFTLWTAFLTMLISFILLGVEEIGQQIENPFGYDTNDLPLDQICQNLLEQIEELTNFSHPETLVIPHSG